VLTFEYRDGDKFFGYDKVIMQAGGIGYGRREDSIKDDPEGGQKIVVMGGDNYRIGMGGGAVSSVATGDTGTRSNLTPFSVPTPKCRNGCSTPSAPSLRWTTIQSYQSMTMVPAGTSIPSPN